MRGNKKVVTGPNENIMKRMVGKDNMGDILIDGVTAKALIDTGCQISTISEAFLKYLKPEPKI